MNLIVRFKNPVFLLTFSSAIIAFVYQILGLFGIVPAIAQDELVKTASLMITLLVSMGVLVDPTTKGITDSEQAMEYDKPKE